MTTSIDTRNQALRDALHAMLWRHKASMTNWTQARADAQRDGELDLASSIANTAIAALSGFPIENAIAALAMQEPASEPVPASAPSCVGFVSPEVIARLLDGRAANSVDISATRGNVFTEPLYVAPASAPSCCEGVTSTDILREWFGGDRYARDYEYLDTSFREQAECVARWLRARAQPCRCGELQKNRIQKLEAALEKVAQEGSIHGGAWCASVAAHQLGISR